MSVRDIAHQTMQALEERLGQSILWVGAVHSEAVRKLMSNKFNLLEISKSMARDRLSSKSVLNLAPHMT